MNNSGFISVVCLCVEFMFAAKWELHCILVKEKIRYYYYYVVLNQIGLVCIVYYQDQ